MGVGVKAEEYSDVRATLSVGKSTALIIPTSA
jgi:hypothetical protein